MPSFFNSAEKVKIFFLKEKDTPEKRKVFARLMTIMKRCVRVSGTKGNFFFHRNCRSLKGKPIMIMEPQGPIDRGIFQEGISRFGETLEGKFRCTKTGYLRLEVNKNLTENNILKFSRAIRRIIGEMTGTMTTGSDDRVQIITPKVRLEQAKAKAAARKQAMEQKKQELEERRRKVAERRAARLQRRENRKRRKAATMDQEVAVEGQEGVPVEGANLDEMPRKRRKNLTHEGKKSERRKQEKVRSARKKRKRDKKKHRID